MNQLRVGFVMEQVLGHVSHYQTLRRVVDNLSSVQPNWVEVTYSGNGLLERLPLLPRSVSGTARGYTQVRNGLRRKQHDALFFHTQKPAVFHWDLLRRIPTVLSLDVTPIQYDELGEYYDHRPDGRSAAASLKHWINVRTFSLAKGIVTWSTWNKESLVRDYRVEPEKVHVIPPGVDLSVWQAVDRAQRTGLPRVLFVGGDFERKGGQLLLEWYRRNGLGRCELDLVTRASIDEEPGVNLYRGITGNSEESRHLFAQADVFVLPSLGECFGIASVEGMAAGLPVITTRLGGSPDVVADGETGFLIRPNSASDLGSALDRVLDDPALRHRMGRAGRARAERLFDGVANAHRIVSCLSQVCPTDARVASVEASQRVLS